MLQGLVTSPCVFLLEDDQESFEASDHITRCLRGLSEGTSIGQCLVNLNFFGSPGDDPIAGGLPFRYDGEDDALTAGSLRPTHLSLERRDPLLEVGDPLFQRGSPRFPLRRDDHFLVRRTADQVHPARLVLPRPARQQDGQRFVTPAQVLEDALDLPGRGEPVHPLTTAPNLTDGLRTAEHQDGDDRLGRFIEIPLPFEGVPPPSDPGARDRPDEDLLVEPIEGPLDVGL